MAPGWIHETVDMIAWGRIYWSVHRRKDSFSRELGTRHRIREHALYQEGLARLRGGMPLPEVLNWIIECAKTRTQVLWGQGLRPDRIEAIQADMAHDYWDLVWDDVTRDQRLGIASAFRDVVLSPQRYPNLFTPDDYVAMHRSGPWKKLQQYVYGRTVEDLVWQAKASHRVR